MVGVQSGHRLEAQFHLKNNNVLNIREVPSLPSKAHHSLFITIG